MRLIEDHLYKSVKKILGKQVPVSKSPFVVTKFTGVRPEVFLHASKLLDFDGAMTDGAKTTRRPVTGPSTYKGIEEERPGRITLVVTCVAGTYTLLQDICSVISPTVLSSLKTLPKIPMGKLPDESTQLHFEDFTSNLHSAKLGRENEDGLTFFKGELIFYLNGFIHVWLTKRGGFTTKAASRPNIKTSRRKSKTTTKPKSGKKAGG